MEFDLNRIFEPGYPGLGVSAKIGSIGDYMSAVAEYLPVVRDQNSIQFRARLKREYPDLQKDDLAEEYESHDWTVNGLIPSLLCDSVLVATWAAFEQGSTSICSYIKDRESCPLTLDGLREQDLKKEN